MALVLALGCARQAEAALYGYCTDDKRPNVISTMFADDRAGAGEQLARDWAGTVARSLNVPQSEVAGRCHLGADRAELEGLYRTVTNVIDEYLIVYVPDAAQAPGTMPATADQPALAASDYQLALDDFARRKAEQRLATDRALREHQLRLQSHAQRIGRYHADLAAYRAALDAYRAERLRRQASGGGEGSSHLDLNPASP